MKKLGLFLLMGILVFFTGCKKDGASKSSSNSSNNVGGGGNNTSTESPDFVTFSDGNIPSSWQTATWYVDNTGGIDDIYSLHVGRNGSVTTSKTIEGNGYLEFYVKSNCNWTGLSSVSDYLKLYVDGRIDNYYFTYEQNGSWLKYKIDLNEGKHTFIWEYDGDAGCSCNIDAIKFTHNSANLRIGDLYQDGYIGYFLDNTRLHGLILSQDDLGTSTGDYATNMCNNYSSGNYSDWMLPSTEEIKTIGSAFLKTGIKINNFQGEYWTSSYSNGPHWYYRYPQNTFGTDYDYYGNYRQVRAIRSF